MPEIPLKPRTLREKAALFEQMNSERIWRLTEESVLCVGDKAEVQAVLVALIANPRCFRFPREIDGLGCLWRGPVPAGVDVNTAKAALDAVRAARH